MKKETSKVTIHMVSSLDGFIANKDNSVSWLDSSDFYEKGITLTKEYIEEFIKTIDCYVMGSQTYEHAIKLGWPYGDVPIVVMTNRDLVSDRKNVQFYCGGLKNLINEQLKPNYKNIWMAGGSKLAKDFIIKNLVDDLIVSIMPVILGAGTLFFDYIGQEKKLHLKDVKAYKDGMVQLCYEINKE